ncbi:11423_t:CDS:2, partial [Funneliformis caledonium]
IMRKIAFLPPPNPIVRLAGDESVPQLGDYVLVMLGRLFQDRYLCNECKRSLIGEKYHEEFSSEFWKDQESGTSDPKGVIPEVSNPVTEILAGGLCIGRK